LTCPLTVQLNLKNNKMFIAWGSLSTAWAKLSIQDPELHLGIQFKAFLGHIGYDIPGSRIREPCDINGFVPCKSNYRHHRFTSMNGLSTWIGLPARCQHIRNPHHGPSRTFYVAEEEGKSRVRGPLDRGRVRLTMIRNVVGMVFRLCQIVWLRSENPAKMWCPSGSNVIYPCILFHALCQPPQMCSHAWLSKRVAHTFYQIETLAIYRFACTKLCFVKYSYSLI
jgi:hypothetical protein